MAVRGAIRRHRTAHQQFAAFEAVVFARGHHRAHYACQNHGYAPAALVMARPIGSTSSRLACGRGITCTAINSPTRRAAAAPASVAAFTAATSPRTIAVT